MVDRYLEVVQKQMMYHKIYDKNDALKTKSAEGRWTTKCTEQYEKMDKIILESVKHADRMVAKRFSTRYEWSPELIRSVNELRYWTLRLKAVKGFRVDQEVIQQYRGSAKLSRAQSDQITARAEIIQYLREAKRSMYENQKHHVELRRSYLDGVGRQRSLIDARGWEKTVTNSKNEKRQKSN